MTEQEAATALALTYSSLEIAETLITIAMQAESLRPSEKIVVTEEQLKNLYSLFRVKGLNEQGETEKRGRPKSNDGPKGKMGKIEK